MAGVRPLAVLGIAYATICPAEDATVIRGATVFTGDDVLEVATVVVRNGLIEAVTEKPVAADDGDTVVDGSGLTLLPGLIDSHTHSWGTAPREALNFGVTTELDMFTDPTLAANWRREQAAGPVVHRADVFSAGILVTVAGGHGTQFFDIPTLDDVEQADAFVAARIAEGSDFIKIVHEPGFAGRTLPTFDGEQLKRIAAAVHRRNKLALFHVSNTAGANMAIAAGADGLMHIYGGPGDPELITALKRQGSFVVPTLAVMGNAFGMGNGDELLADPRLAPYLSTSGRANLQRSFAREAHAAGLEVVFANVRALHEAGVPILAGTDATNPGVSHGVSLHGELELLTRAGLTPRDALRAATAAAADAFGLEDRGRVAVGLKADLILVRGNPLKDITATRELVAVFKDGERFERRRETPAEPRRVAIGPRSLGDFDDPEVDPAASGWVPSTDSMAGGKSAVELGIAVPGANGSKGSLRIEGEIVRGYPYPWSGALIGLGEVMMQPVDASGIAKLVFDARGAGGTYRAMAFAESLGQMPAIVDFAAGEEWRRIEIPLSAFPGMDPRGASAFFIGGPDAIGEFWLEVDNVALVD